MRVLENTLEKPHMSGDDILVDTGRRRGIQGGHSACKRETVSEGDDVRKSRSALWSVCGEAEADRHRRGSCGEEGQNIISTAGTASAKDWRLPL